MDELHEVKAPMVGVYYEAPAPTLPPFVAVGDRVTAATEVCIIEIMKTMCSIEAEVDGVVEEILLENGQEVEAGQVIMTIRPS